MKPRPTKILPNNSPLAVAARGGEVIEAEAPPQPMKGFEPWSRDQSRYESWFRRTMAGAYCQCSARCFRRGEQVHHEEYGADKDGRTLVWLSRHCHHEVRHHHSCPEEVVLNCRASAGDNWRAYESTLGP